MQVPYTPVKLPPQIGNMQLPYTPAKLPPLRDVDITVVKDAQSPPELNKNTQKEDEDFKDTPELTPSPDATNVTLNLTQMPAQFMRNAYDTKSPIAENNPQLMSMPNNLLLQQHYYHMYHKLLQHRVFVRPYMYKNLCPQLQNQPLQSHQVLQHLIHMSNQ